MKICLLGQYSGNLDEGMKSITFHLYQELSKHHKLMAVSPKETLSGTTIRKIREFHPQIIHYLHGPSIKSLVITKYLAKMLKGCKTIISATHPAIWPWQRKMVTLFKPNLLLVQSHKAEKFFSSLGCATKFTPLSGVDLNHFRPATDFEKASLRKKYGLKENEFIILHLGPLRKNRNLQVLGKIQRKIKIQVLIIGSSSLRADRRLLSSLQRSGCIVWLKYFPHIEELFKLADVYIFPTIDSRGAVETPLSVLEAMACNLPVVTTRFGALPRLFCPGEGIWYVQKEEDIIDNIEQIKKGLEVNTRRRVLSYSWEKIAQAVEKVYRQIG